MKRNRVLVLLPIAALTLAACGKTLSSPTAAVNPTEMPAERTATPRPAAEETAAPPESTAVVTSGWSTTASTRTELSFGFPGEWDGASPLTFGEGVFIKEPDQPIGATFQIGLSGETKTLLDDWGKKDIGIVGIMTFTPESVTDGPAVTIARIEAPTKIARGDGITARIVYIQRAGDVLEVMWFAPDDQWETLQPVFQDVLDSIEIWRRFTNSTLGLHSMYVHDWLAPQPTDPEKGLWFQSADRRTGVLLYIHDEIADPVKKLGDWDTERLAVLGYSGCTEEPGDRMGAFGGTWESLTGVCSGADGKQAAYEAAFIPNKDRLIEIITYSPLEEWETANEKSFGCLLGMMIDLR
ncbi:MAG: hypothetical protein JW748_08400 [Anaerolineales bacterium]|nr:hypothetical protein [Anaerolineales bacterium]